MPATPGRRSLLLAAGATTAVSVLSAPAAGSQRPFHDGPLAIGHLREIAEYADWIGPDTSSLVPPSPLRADAHAAGLKVGAYTFRAENQFLPAALRRGSDPNAFGDAFAEYALHYSLGVDAVVTDFPDLAVISRQEGGRAGSTEDRRLITAGR